MVARCNGNKAVVRILIMQAYIILKLNPFQVSRCSGRSFDLQSSDPTMLSMLGKSLTSTAMAFHVLEFVMQLCYFISYTEVVNMSSA